jgi:hypothetical protein
VGGEGAAVGIPPKRSPRAQVVETVLSSVDDPRDPSRVRHEIRVKNDGVDRLAFRWVRPVSGPLGEGFDHHGADVQRIGGDPDTLACRLVEPGPALPTSPIAPRIESDHDATIGGPRR